VIRPIHAALRAADTLDEVHDRRTFAHVARGIALGAYGAEADERQPREAATILKAAITGSTLLGEADGIGDFLPASRAFSATLSQIGTFDWMLGSMAPGVLHTRFGVAVSHLAAGGEIEDGAGKPVVKLAFAPQSLAGRRAACIAVLSKDLLRHARGVDVIENALRAGQVRSTDSIFLAAVSAVASAGSNSGSSAVHVLADLLAAVTTLAPGTESALHCVVKPAVARRLAFMPLSFPVAALEGSPAALAVGQYAAGARAFGEMTPTGGVLCGIPCRASDEAVDDVTVIDAAGYVGAAEDVQLARSEHASIEMASVVTQHLASGNPSPPEPVAAQLVNLWQANSVAIRAEWQFGFTPMRAAAVKINSVSWGQ
jgi:hypothetical protein